MSSHSLSPPPRIRVEFEDPHILSKRHRFAGLCRCWLLLHPHFSTVADVTSHLSDSFSLDPSSPHSLMLSIDEYVLPPFELVSIFRDGDVVRVRKKDAKQKKLHHDSYCDKRSHILETRSLVVNNTCLAIENSRGYLEDCRGKSVENAHEVEDISVSGRTALNGETSFKRKRELSKKPKESKGKKLKINNSKELNISDGEKEAEPDDSGNLCHKMKCIIDISDGKEILDKPVSSPVDVKMKNEITREMRSGENEEDCCAVSGEIEVCGNSEKSQSRSARRKKAKRKMRREMAKQQMGEQVQEESQKVTGDTQEAILNKDTVDRRINACLEESKSPKSHKDEIGNHHIVDKRIDTEEVVPIIVRPGHIRFGSIDEEHDEPQSNAQMGTLQWNGVTNKKKGQKWGRQKTSSKVNDDTFCEGSTNEKLHTNVSTNGKLNTEEIKHVDENNINFESLFPLTRSPKEGDVLVYRVVELSSSWCPELSSFRVGKVSSYDNISLKIVLSPVPEYPICCIEEKDGEQVNVSTYLEDGSLEIEYPSLVDVRLLRACESEATVTHGEKNGITKESAQSDNINHGEVEHNANGSIVPVAGTSCNSGWEQINQALNEKKTELQKKDDWGTWNRNENAFVPWPYRGPKRHAALGPTLAFLRGVTGIGGNSSGRGKYRNPR